MTIQELIKTIPPGRSISFNKDIMYEGIDVEVVNTITGKFSKHHITDEAVDFTDSKVFDAILVNLLEKLGNTI